MIDLPTKLNRFTNLKELNQIIHTRRLVLRDTSSWEDKNDAEIIKEYERIRRKKVFTKCFCSGNETIHHWEHFAGDETGCCIEFDPVKLLRYVDSTNAARHGLVKYRYIKDVEARRPALEDFPFVKRKPYRIEREYRIICLGSERNAEKYIPIELDCIRKITFSPRISKDLFKTKKATLRKRIKRSVRELKINRSTVLESARWINAFHSSDSLRSNSG